MPEHSRCQAHLGRGRCKAELQVTFDALGRMRVHCPACARRAAGYCRLCPARLQNPRSWYCPRCAERKRKARNARAVQRDDYRLWKQKYEQKRYKALKKDKAAYKAWLARGNAARRARYARIKATDPERYAEIRAMQRADYQRRRARGTR